jgi:hypothetical protein
MSLGSKAWFSVRADLLHTGEQPEMANRIPGTYVTTAFLGSLETDVFEIAPNVYIHVEQHRSVGSRDYRMGEREMICWPADAGVLLDSV